MHCNEYVLSSIVQKIVMDVWCGSSFFSLFEGGAYMHGFSPSSLASDAAYVWFRLGAERCSGKVFFFVTRLRRHLHSVTQEVAAAMFIFLMARISTEQFLIFYRRTDTSVWRTHFCDMGQNDTFMRQVSGGHIVVDKCLEDTLLLTSVWRTRCC